MIKLPKTDFSTMWIGNPLSRLEILSLKSFLHYGYSIAVYLYDMNLEVPEGVIKANANYVIPESSAYSVQGSYSIFSDYFRYKMLSMVDTVWVDMDCICLSDNFPLHDEYFFAPEQINGLVNGAVLKYPMDSEMAKFVLDEYYRLDAKNQYEKDPDFKWAITGPWTVTKAVNELKLHDYVYPVNSAYPIDYFDIRYYFEPSLRDAFFRKACCSLIAHCSNVSITLRKQGEKYDKTVFPEGSALYELEQRLI